MVSSISNTSGLDIAALKKMQEKIFKAMDSNGDNTIDKDEMSAFQKSQQADGKQGPTVDEIFEMQDSDNDGAITMQESEAVLAKLAQQMHGQGAPPPRPSDMMDENDPMAQIKEDFDAFGSALQSGNLSDAKKALAALQENAPAQGSQPSEIDSLSKALESDDLQGARDAYSHIQEKISHRPPEIASSENGVSQSSSARDDVLNALLAALSSKDDSNVSTDTTRSSASTASVTSVSEILATALKNYTQWSGGTYTENTQDITQLSSVFG